MCISKVKTNKRKGEIKTTTTKENEKQKKEKYLHSVHKVVIKRNTSLELGHSPDRCLDVPLDSVI